MAKFAWRNLLTRPLRTILALIVGVINTTLLSTTERFVEFGVLRTNGWSRGNILALVTLESAYLGLLAGLIGCAFTAIAALLISRLLLGTGIHLGLELGDTGVRTNAADARHPAWPDPFG
jgi:putative ABC transport system permease protein